MANIKFTLGECSITGKNYRFDYDNGKYLILELFDESEKLIDTISESATAYKKWNEIKRPEKAKR